MPEERPAALQSQIEQLERELAAKRAELGSDAAAPIERGEVHAAVGERIRQVVPGYQPQQTSATSSATSALQDPQFAAAVQGFVNIAFTQSIQQAIAEALKTGNPALVDALHDILTDQFHEELVARQKVQAAP